MRAREETDFDTIGPSGPDLSLQIFGVLLVPNVNFIPSENLLSIRGFAGP